MKSKLYITRDFPNVITYTYTYTFTYTYLILIKGYSAPNVSCDRSCEAVNCFLDSVSGPDSRFLFILFI